MNSRLGTHEQPRAAAPGPVVTLHGPAHHRVLDTTGLLFTQSEAQVTPPVARDANRTLHRARKTPADAPIARGRHDHLTATERGDQEILGFPRLILESRNP